MSWWRRRLGGSVLVRGRSLLTPRPAMPVRDAAARKWRSLFGGVYKRMSLDCLTVPEFLDRRPDSLPRHEVELC